MAACVSMALQRWIKALVREWCRRARAWRAKMLASWQGASGTSRLHHSSVLHLQSQKQRGGSADPGGVLGRFVPCSSSSPLELCLCIDLPACVGAPQWSPQCWTRKFQLHSSCSSHIPSQHQLPIGLKCFLVWHRVWYGARWRRNFSPAPPVLWHFSRLSFIPLSVFDRHDVAHSRC